MKGEKEKRPDHYSGLSIENTHVLNTLVVIIPTHREWHLLRNDNRRLTRF